MWFIIHTIWNTFLSLTDQTNCTVLWSILNDQPKIKVRSHGTRHSHSSLSCILYWQIYKQNYGRSRKLWTSIATDCWQIVTSNTRDEKSVNVTETRVTKVLAARSRTKRVIPPRPKFDHTTNQNIPLQMPPQAVHNFECQNNVNYFINKIERTESYWTIENC